MNSEQFLYDLGLMLDAITTWFATHSGLILTAALAILGFLGREMLAAWKIEAAADRAIANRVDNYRITLIRLKNFRAEALGISQQQLTFPFLYHSDDDNDLIGLYEPLYYLGTGRAIKRITRRARHAWLLEKFLGEIYRMSDRLFFDKALSEQQREYLFRTLASDTSYVIQYLEIFISSSGDQLFPDGLFVEKPINPDFGEASKS